MKTENGLNAPRGILCFLTEEAQEVLDSIRSRVLMPLGAFCVF